MSTLCIEEETWDHIWVCLKNKENQLGVRDFQE
jgi:hypothetical protein